jgi:hypothetical protein
MFEFIIVFYSDAQADEVELTKIGQEVKSYSTWCFGWKSPLTADLGRKSAPLMSFNAFPA